MQKKKFNPNGPWTIERFDRYYVMTVGKKTTYTMQMKGSDEIIPIDKKVWDDVRIAMGKEADLLFYTDAYNAYMRRTYPGWYPEWWEEAEKINAGVVEWQTQRT